MIIVASGILEVTDPVVVNRKKRIQFFSQNLRHPLGIIRPFGNQYIFLLFLANFVVVQLLVDVGFSARPNRIPFS